MPQNGHDTRVALETDEVEHKRVDDLVRQRVLLVEEHTDEETVGAWWIIRVSRESKFALEGDGPV